MGFRTVVILNNDSSWDDDPHLAQKISRAAAQVYGFQRENEMMRGYFDGGMVVEVAHADTETLLQVSSLNAKELALGWWTGRGNEDEVLRGMLLRAADKLGYKLVHKPIKEENNGGV